MNSLSFCLWDGAGIIDAIAARYVSTLFAFTLVFAIVKIMKLNCLCCKYLTIITITEGISAFLVPIHSVQKQHFKSCSGKLCALLLGIQKF